MRIIQYILHNHGRWTTLDQWNFFVATIGMLAAALVIAVLLEQWYKEQEQAKEHEAAWKDHQRRLHEEAHECIGLRPDETKLTRTLRLVHITRDETAEHDAAEPGKDTARH